MWSLLWGWRMRPSPTHTHSYLPEQGKRGSPGPLTVGRATSSICQAHAEAHVTRSAIIGSTVIMPSSKTVQMLARREGMKGPECGHEFLKGTSRRIWSADLLPPGARQMARERVA